MGPYNLLVDTMGAEMRPSLIVRAVTLIIAVLSLAAFCEVEESWAPCDGVTCSDRGECVLGDDSPICECDEGFEPLGLACVPPGTNTDAGLDADVDDD